MDTVGTHAQLLGFLPRIVTIPNRRVSTPHDHYPMKMWVLSCFRNGRVPTLRWLPHWLGAAIARWTGWIDRWPRWLRFALHAPPLPQRLLDPWATARGCCTWSATPNAAQR